MFTRLSSIYFYWNEDYSAPIARAGQTPWVRWWGDSEQRQAPSATVGTGATSDPWPHRGGSLSGWLSQRLCGPPDHKHSPWAGWTVMDGSPRAARSAQSASCGVNRLTSRWCVYVDVRPDNSRGSSEGFCLDQLEKEGDETWRDWELKSAGVRWALLSNKRRLHTAFVSLEWFFLMI